MSETVLLRTACGCRRLMTVQRGTPTITLTLPLSTAKLGMCVEVRKFERTDLTEDYLGCLLAVYGEKR